jgi:hypothetical protein
MALYAPSSRTGAGGPQAEERAIAADAHRIAWVPCDEFLFFVFLAEALKKIMVCPVVKKRSLTFPPFMHGVKTWSLTRAAHVRSTDRNCMIFLS